MKRHIDWFEVWVACSLGTLALCLIAVIAEGIHVAITGTPLVGEWIGIGDVVITCK